MVLRNTGTYLVNVYSVVKDRRKKKILLLIPTGRSILATQKQEKLFIIQIKHVSQLFNG